MAYEIKDNTGSIFANDSKETESHPDGKGAAKIGGVEYWVKSWNNKTKDGKPYRKLSFTPKDEKAAAPPKRQVGGVSDTDLDDSVPF